MGEAAIRSADDDFETALLDLHVLRKCAYELDYERNFRPTWIDVPLKGMIHVMEEGN